MPYMVLRMQGFNCMVKCTKEAEQVEGTEGVYEAQVGDDTGVFTVSFRNKDLMQNTSVRMVKGFIRVVVDKWAAFKPADAPLEFEAKDGNNLSALRKLEVQVAKEKQEAARESLVAKPGEVGHSCDSLFFVTLIAGSPQGRQTHEETAGLRLSERAGRVANREKRLAEDEAAG
eukprot:g20544.t1